MREKLVGSALTNIWDSNANMIDFLCILVAAALFSLSSGMEAKAHRKLRMASEDAGIAGQFIVILKDAANDERDQDTTFFNGGLISSIPEMMNELKTDLRKASIVRTFEQSKGFRGFAVSSLFDEDELETLLNHDDVILVEQDQRAQTYATQTSPPWGLDRISQDEPSPLDSKYGYAYTGKGVKVYVIDTGIMSSHEDFAGRVTCGFNARSGTEDCEDGDGHGTHVAGTCEPISICLMFCSRHLSY